MLANPSRSYDIFGSTQGASGTLHLPRSIPAIPPHPYQCSGQTPKRGRGVPSPTLPGVSQRVYLGRFRSASLTVALNELPDHSPRQSVSGSDPVLRDLDLIGGDPALESELPSHFAKCRLHIHYFLMAKLSTSRFHDTRLQLPKTVRWRLSHTFVDALGSRLDAWWDLLSDIPDIPSYPNHTGSLSHAWRLLVTHTQASRVFCPDLATSVCKLRPSSGVSDLEVVVSTMRTIHPSHRRGFPPTLRSPIKLSDVII